MSCSDRYACSSHVGLLRDKYKTTFCQLELTTSVDSGVEGHGLTPSTKRQGIAYRTSGQIRKIML